MEKLDREELDELVMRAKSGDNEAWNSLLEACKDFIHDRAWKMIKGKNIKDPKRLEEELFQAGWIGFSKAIRRFAPGKASFLTYASHDIDGEMSKQLDFEFGNGITDKPKEVKIIVERHDGDPVEEQRAFEMEISGAEMRRRAMFGTSLPEPTDHEIFSQGRRALQILEVLKKMTDEDHALNKADLQEQLHYYRIAKHGNDSTLTIKKGELGLHSDNNTYTKDLMEMLTELDPLRYTGDNEDDYLVRYSGYKDDGLYKKLNKIKGRKAAPITDFSYNHLFDKDTLDRLIQLICFSDMFSDEEKSRLIGKLVGTASIYYDTPFMDGSDLKFNPRAIHGRFSQRNGANSKLLTDNIKTIQFAINNLAQIRFRFNRYTSDHKMVPKNAYTYVLSPYHMVVYHDNYYVIGLNQAWGDKRVLHYRVDLMSDIEIAKDDEEKIIPIEVCDFDGLPIGNASWDPEKYMSEHLNMAFDEPRDIKIKIPETEYTLIHSWFGDHYEKVDSVVGTDENGNEINYDIVVVKTSPFMIVGWAMQYGTTVEIMNEDIREEISKKLSKMVQKYAG